MIIIIDYHTGETGDAIAPENHLVLVAIRNATQDSARTLHMALRGSAQPDQPASASQRAARSRKRQR